jgi:hypothetical protein
MFLAASFRLQKKIRNPCFIQQKYLSENIHLANKLYFQKELGNINASLTKMQNNSNAIVSILVLQLCTNILFLVV